MCVNDISANQKGIDALAAELNDTYGKGSAVGVAADVTKGDDVQRLIDESVNALGPLTVMVANAGIAQYVYILPSICIAVLRGSPVRATS